MPETLDLSGFGLESGKWLGTDGEAHDLCIGPGEGPLTVTLSPEFIFMEITNVTGEPVHIRFGSAVVELPDGATATVGEPPPPA